MHFSDRNGERVAFPQATIPFHAAQFHFIQLMDILFLGNVMDWHLYWVPPKESNRTESTFGRVFCFFKTWAKSTCPAQNSSPHIARNPFRADISFSLCLCVIFSCLHNITPYMLLSRCSPSAFSVRFDLVIYWSLPSVYYLRNSQDRCEHFHSPCALDYQDNCLTCSSLHGATCQLKGFQWAPVNPPGY